VWSCNSWYLSVSHIPMLPSACIMLVYSFNLLLYFTNNIKSMNIIVYPKHYIYDCVYILNIVLHMLVSLFFSVPAHIVDELSTRDIRLLEGAVARLLCNATGVPEPTITWYRRTYVNKRIRERKLYRIMSNHSRASID
jgi:hypothetical protein